MCHQGSGPEHLSRRAVGLQEPPQAKPTAWAHVRARHPTSKRNAQSPSCTYSTLLGRAGIGMHHTTCARICRLVSWDLKDLGMGLRCSTIGRSRSRARASCCRNAWVCDVMFCCVGSDAASSLLTDGIGFPIKFPSISAFRAPHSAAPRAVLPAQKGKAKESVGDGPVSDLIEKSGSQTDDAVHPAVPGIAIHARKHKSTQSDLLSPRNHVRASAKAAVIMQVTVESNIAASPTSVDRLRDRPDLADRAAQSWGQTGLLPTREIVSRTDEPGHRSPMQGAFDKRFFVPDTLVITTTSPFVQIIRLCHAMQRKRRNPVFQIAELTRAGNMLANGKSAITSLLPTLRPDVPPPLVLQKEPMGQIPFQFKRRIFVKGIAAETGHQHKDQQRCQPARRGIGRSDTPAQPGHTAPASLAKR